MPVIHDLVSRYLQECLRVAVVGGGDTQLLQVAEQVCEAGGGAGVWGRWWGRCVEQVCGAGGVVQVVRGRWCGQVVWGR